VRSELERTGERAPTLLAEDDRVPLSIVATQIVHSVTIGDGCARRIGEDPPTRCGKTTSHWLCGCALAVAEDAPAGWLWIEGVFELVEGVGVAADRLVEAAELAGVLVVDGLQRFLVFVCAVFEVGEALLEEVEVVA
jgi:hypothetical protein